MISFLITYICCEFKIFSEKYLFSRLSQRREKLKIQRKHAASRNPLKLLASRSDLKQDYDEVYKGVAERELERLKLEKCKFEKNIFFYNAV